MSPNSGWKPLSKTHLKIMHLERINFLDIKEKERNEKVKFRSRFEFEAHPSLKVLLSVCLITTC